MADVMCCHSRQGSNRWYDWFRANDPAPSCEPRSAFDVTLTVVEAQLNECPGLLGYADLFATVDWESHTGRRSKLARTNTIWGATTEASWRHPCPKRVWVRPGRCHVQTDGEQDLSAAVEGEARGSVTFTVKQETMAGLGIPRTVGWVTVPTQELLEMSGGGIIGSERKEFVLMGSRASAGTIVVDIVSHVARPIQVGQFSFQSDTTRGSSLMGPTLSLPDGIVSLPSVSRNRSRNPAMRASSPGSSASSTSDSDTEETIVQKARSIMDRWRSSRSSDGPPRMMPSRSIQPSNGAGSAPRIIRSHVKPRESSPSSTASETQFGSDEEGGDRGGYTLEQQVALAMMKHHNNQSPRKGNNGNTDGHLNGSGPRAMASLRPEDATSRADSIVKASSERMKRDKMLNHRVKGRSLTDVVPLLLVTVKKYPSGGRGYFSGPKDRFIAICGVDENSVHTPRGSERIACLAWYESKAQWESRQPPLGSVPLRHLVKAHASTGGKADAVHSIVTIMYEEETNGQLGRLELVFDTRAGADLWSQHLNELIDLVKAAEL
mmetsp:Transcript_6327/g.15717  ORF Transcript_6327/g.15717 Transcript_6327/m.15717 type:complete len:549 (+) Transcript_6327:40-1686(+)